MGSKQNIFDQTELQNIDLSNDFNKLIRVSILNANEIHGNMNVNVLYNRIISILDNTYFIDDFNIRLYV